MQTFQTNVNAKNYDFTKSQGEPVKKTRKSVQKKKTRNKYFQTIVSLKLHGRILRSLSSEEIGIVFRMTKFVSQAALQAAFHSLIIKDRGRSIFLDSFQAQLETNDNEDLPY